MRRAVITTVVTAAGLVALLSYKSSGPTKLQKVSFSAGSSTTTTTVPQSSGQSSSRSSGPSAGAGKSGPATTAPPTTSAARETYDGQLVQYFYGDIQVDVTVQGGRVVSVTVPENGAADAHSEMINSYAVPVLEKEALAAQGLSFDAVSGATYTSDAFAQSLQSALQKAGK